jgi:hypothetical protein
MYFPNTMKTILRWISCSEDEIDALTFEAMRNVDNTLQVQTKVLKEISFKPEKMPELRLLREESVDSNCIAIRNYVQERGFPLDSFDWMWERILH